MKRIVFALSLLGLMMVSCTGNDDETNNESTVLLKKTIEVDGSGESLTTVYTYNGNKIVRADYAGYKILFTYSGDNITKMEFLDSQNNADKIENFTYDASDRLVTYILVEPDDNYGRKEVYVYDADGTVRVTAYNGEVDSQTILRSTGRVFYGANNEISKMEEYYGNVTDTRNYTYDSKNNPFKNILGFGKLSFVHGEGDGVLHNTLTANLVSNDGNENVTYQYTYNASGYPQTSTKNRNGSVRTAQYFYE